jgi:predicted SprT family Zn-dependent metalloprotease
MSRRQKTALAVTQEAYAELQQAYDHFNVELFEGKLPHCLITLNRKDRRCMGYFSPTRFAHRLEPKRYTDEIALNPVHFHAKIGEILQTLVHEMVHLWQQHHGKPPRKAYHDRQWAAQMEAVGLMPSSTGKPGGAKTGQKMADYPIAGGAFEKAAKKLMADKTFKLSWYDRAQEIAKPGGAVGGGDGEEGEGKPSRSGKRVKFTCPGCEANAWGKASLVLICGECRETFKSEQAA